MAADEEGAEEDEDEEQEPEDQDEEQEPEDQERDERTLEADLRASQTRLEAEEARKAEEADRLRRQQAERSRPVAIPAPPAPRVLRRRVFARRLEPAANGSARQPAPVDGDDGRRRVGIGARGIAAGHTHPLFPQAPDAPPRERAFVWIHLSRLRDDGSVENHPRRFPAVELQTWQDIYEACGGGDYRLQATDEEARFVAFFPPKRDEFYTLGGAQRPFMPDNRSGYKKTVRAGSVQRTRDDGRQERDAGEPAKPPREPTIAEVMAALPAMIAAAVHGPGAKAADESPTMLLLKMMEIQSNERRTAAIEAREAAKEARDGAPKSDATTELLKLVLTSREKPMSFENMLALAKQLGGEKSGGGLEQVAATMRLMKEINPPAPAGGSDLGEITNLIGTLATASKDSAKSEEKPSSQGVYVPGVGVVTAPVPGLMRRLDAAVGVALSTPQPAAVAPAAVAPAPAAVAVVAAAAPPPATVVAAAAAAPAAPPEASAPPPPVMPPPLSATDAPESPAAIPESAAAAPAPAPPAMQPRALTADDVVSLLQSDPAFKAEVAERLRAARTAPPAPVQEGPSAEAARTSEGAIPLGPPAAMNGSYALPPAMIKLICAMPQDQLANMLEKALGPKSAQEFAMILCQMPDMAKEEFIKQALPADGLRAIQSGAIQLPRVS